VKKSNDKLYWYGMAADALDETDSTGSTTNSAFNEYVFFVGRRIARRNSSSTVLYYFEDHLRTSREIVQAGQTTPCYDADFYPYGGERTPIVNTCSQSYKFTGKERDSESGLDDMGARYYSSSMGRFTISDPMFLNADRLAEPQRLNLYLYSRDNPLRYFDPTGLDDITYDQSGKEIDRQNQHGRWWHLFHDDTYTLQADNGKTYKLDAPLTPLKNGERYEIVPAAVTGQILGDFVAKQANRGHEFTTLAEVLQKSPSRGDWDFKRKALTPRQNRTSLFEMESGSLYHGDYVGNVAFGFIMASGGYPAVIAEAGAGGYQTYEALRGRTGFGSISSFGDDPRDTEAIGKGYALWPKYSFPNHHFTVLPDTWICFNCSR